jgi:hypothetical protein
LAIDCSWSHGLGAVLNSLQKQNLAEMKQWIIKVRQQQTVPIAAAAMEQGSYQRLAKLFSVQFNFRFLCRSFSGFPCNSISGFQSNFRFSMQLNFRAIQFPVFYVA